MNVPMPLSADTERRESHVQTSVAWYVAADIAGLALLVWSFVSDTLSFNSLPTFGMGFAFIPIGLFIAPIAVVSAAIFVVYKSLIAHPRVAFSGVLACLSLIALLSPLIASDLLSADSAVRLLASQAVLCGLVAIELSARRLWNFRLGLFYACVVLLISSWAYLCSARIAADV